MQKMIRLPLLILCLLTFSVSGTMAQKLGYVNTTQLLEGLSLMKEANTELQALQQKYMTEGQAKVKSLETNYAAYMEEANAGNLSKKQMAEREAKLQQERQELMDYDTKAKVSIEAQREAIFRPILQKIDQVIQQYGEENGYDFILDSGMGNLLFKKSADDLTEVIRQKLENQ